MKRILFLFLALALIVGCKKDDDAVILPQRGEATENAAPDVIYASIEDEEDDDPQSRTYADGQNVLWHNGDAIAYYSGSYYSKYVNTEADGAAKATFKRVLDKFMGVFTTRTYAIYPYDNVTSISTNNESGTVRVEYPSAQIYAENSFSRGDNIMVAASKLDYDFNLYFYNACGFLIIKLYGEGTNVKSITLSPVNDENIIAGTADITMNIDDTPPTINMFEDTPVDVTLDCSQYNDGAGVALGATAENATEFWIVLPPVTFTNGLEITVTSMDDKTFVKKTTKELTIARNTIQPMAALKFVSSTPDAHQLYYTTSDGQAINFSHLGDDEKPFNANIVNHVYDKDNGMWVITFQSAPTSINEKAFYEKANLTSVTLPEGISFIGENAFARTGLTELTIPGSVTKIDVDAFYLCEALKKLTFLPSPNGTQLEIGHGIDSGAKRISPFYYSPLEEIYLDRTFSRIIDSNGETFEYYIIDGNEQPLGIFQLEVTNNLKRVTLGSQVTKLNKYMFYNINSPDFTTITIPGTVKMIEGSAFYNCTTLTTVNLESGIENIGDSAFRYTGLREVDVPGSVTNIGDRAFFNNYYLTSLTLNEGIETIGEYAFANAKTLTQITIPDSVEEIGDYAFAARSEAPVSNLESVDLGDGVKTLGEGVFYGCKLLESISIPANVTKIGINTFYGCTSLNTVTIEEGDSPLRIGGLWRSDKTYDFGPFFDSPLKNITVFRNMQIIDDEGQDSSTTDANGMFNLSSNAPSNTNVTLGGKLTKINEYMFRSLDITSISIPASVTTIGNFAFDYCSALKEVTFEAGTTDLIIGFQDHSDEVGPFYDSPLEKVTVNRNLVHSADYSASCNQWDEGVFTNFKYDDANFTTSITLGEQVKSILPYMFSNVRINNLKIPNSVTEIGCYAFYECPVLGSLTIPASVTTIEHDAFHACEALTSVTFESGTADLKIGPTLEGSDEYGPFYDTQLVTLNLDRNLVPTYTINYDEEGLFSEKETLKNVTLGKNVKSIQNRMFLETGITSITIPNSVSKIDIYAFFKCESLENITISGSVTEIGVDAFYNCKSLSTITFEPSDTATPLRISQGFTSGGSDLGPFYYSPLKTINLKRELVYIDKNGNNFVPDWWDEGVFTNFKYNDNNFKTSINIGEQVRTILPYMFSCTRVQYIWIPNTVTSIGKRAFYYCLAFEGLSCNHTEPPTLGDNAFEDCDAMWYIKVPAESMSKFKSANNWKDYNRNNPNGRNFYYTL